MGWCSEKKKNKKNQPFPTPNVLNGGDYKEVSKKYINKTTEEMVTICYDCGKQRYIESLMVVSAIDGFTIYKTVRWLRLVFYLSQYRH